MKIVDVETNRGLVLKGVMWGDSTMDTVVVMMSGICSNVFNNEFFRAIGEKLNQNNIAYIVGQSMDAFSILTYTNVKTNKKEATGVVFDDFDCVYEDVDAYVQYAKSLGFKKFILAGHSLGSNKVIHYLSKNRNEAVKNFIISSPVDLSDFFDRIPEINMYLETASSFVENGKGQNILPFLFMDFSPMCADTLLQFYTNETLKNCPVISENGETESLAAIDISGAFVIGDKDHFANGDSLGYISKINSFCKDPEKNTLHIVDGGSHIFFNKHNEFADAIQKCVVELMPL